LKELLIDGEKNRSALLIYVKTIVFSRHKYASFRDVTALSEQEFVLLFETM
jgi:hypothetical protein